MVLEFPLVACASQASALERVFQYTQHGGTVVVIAVSHQEIRLCHGIDPPAAARLVTTGTPIATASGILFCCRARCSGVRPSEQTVVQKATDPVTKTPDRSPQLLHCR